MKSAIRASLALKPDLDVADVLRTVSPLGRALNGFPESKSRLSGPHMSKLMDRRVQSSLLGVDYDVPAPINISIDFRTVPTCLVAYFLGRSHTDPLGETSLT